MSLLREARVATKFSGVFNLNDSAGDVKGQVRKTNPEGYTGGPPDYGRSVYESKRPVCYRRLIRVGLTGKLTILGHVVASEIL